MKRIRVLHEQHQSWAVNVELPFVEFEGTQREMKNQVN